MEPATQDVQKPLIEQTEKPKTKLPFCIFLLSNGAVGAGILTLTSAVGKVGWGLGLCLYLFFGVFAGYANMMVQRAFTVVEDKFKNTDVEPLVENSEGAAEAKKAEEPTYSGIAEKIWCKGFGVFVDLIQFLYSFGTCCGYAIIIANELYLSVSFLTEGKEVPPSMEFLTHREWLLVIATIFVILPPSLLRKLTALRYTSIVAISGILYITLVMFYRATNTHSCGLAEVADFSCTMGQCMIEANAALGNYTGYADCSLFCEGCEPSPIKSALQGFIFDKKTLFAVLPIFCFGHCSQVQFVPILSDLEKPTRKRVGYVVLGAYMIIFTLYVINSFSGYFSFCGYSASNVLDSYPALDPLILVGRLIISFALCFTFPLYGYAVREVVLKTFKLSDSYGIQVLVTMLLVFSCMTVGIIFNDLSTVIGVTGAIGGSSLMCIIPSIMYMRYVKVSDCKNKCWNYTLASFYLIFGVVMAVVGTVVTLVH